MAPLGNAPKDLSADSLFRSLRSRFDSLPDPRPRSEEIRIPLGDALMSAFAMFSLKGPSLLAFDHRRRDPLDNSRSIYGIDQVPCDSQLRDILDPLDPDHLRSGFRDVSRRLQRGKAWDASFISTAVISCRSMARPISPPPRSLAPRACKGTIAAAASPIPINCRGPPWSIPTSRKSSPWLRSRSSSRTARPRTTASRDATRRWLQRCRREHPHLPVIVVEDALAADAPHLEDLRGPRAFHHRRQAGRPRLPVRAPAGP